MTIFPRLFVLGGALLMANAAFAHHSGAMFDRAQTIELKGTVKEYQFTNPHVWIELMVPGAAGAAPTQWSIEGEGPPTMNHIGLTRSVLKVGDQVTLRIHPLRNSQPGGSFIDLTTASGKLITSNGNAPVSE